LACLYSRWKLTRVATSARKPDTTQPMMCPKNRRAVVSAEEVVESVAQTVNGGRRREKRNKDEGVGHYVFLRGCHAERPLGQLGPVGRRSSDTHATTLQRCVGEGMRDAEKRSERAEGDGEQKCEAQRVSNVTGRKSWSSSCRLTRGGVGVLLDTGASREAAGTWPDTPAQHHQQRQHSKQQQ